MLNARESFCLNLSRSRASRRCERECRTKAHHGRKLNGMTIALISAKGGSRSERAQTQTAQAKTSCGEPRPSKRPRGCRPHGSQPLDSRSGIRPFGYCRCNPLRQPLWDQTLWVLSVQQHGNHVKSSLRRSCMHYSIINSRFGSKLKLLAARACIHVILSFTH